MVQRVLSRQPVDGNNPNTFIKPEAGSRPSMIESTGSGDGEREKERFNNDLCIDVSIDSNTLSDEVYLKMSEGNLNPNPNPNSNSNSNPNAITDTVSNTTGLRDDGEKYGGGLSKEGLPVKSVNAGEAAERVWKYLNTIPNLIQEHCLSKALAPNTDLKDKDKG
jgi:hypothetical protein